MPWIFPLFLLIAFEILADIFAKEWSLRGNVWYLALGALVCYIIGNSFWLLALKSGSGLARGAIIFCVATAIFTTLLGLWWYHERVSGIQLAGIIVGIISIILIFWE